MGLLVKRPDEPSKKNKGLISKTKSWNLQRKAESGDIQSQYQLGLNYLEGKDVDASIIDATKWLGIAANNGNIQAQIMLADICFEGKLIEPQPEIAFKWYILASNQGDVHSTYRCGMMLLEGKGCLRSVENAIKFIFSAAERGDFDASLTVAFLYRDGIGVPKSPQLAEKWFNVVTTKGKNCDGYIVQMYTELAQKGDMESIYKLVGFYENNKYGIDVSDETYYGWVKTIADTGNPDYCLKLGKYRLSNGGSKYYSEALHYLNKAADMGVGEAYFLLAKNHFNTNQINQGIRCMVEASEYGVDEADLYLGSYFYKKGDYNNAIEWLDIPERKDMGDSRLMMAVSLENVGALEAATYQYFSILDRIGNAKRLEVASNLDHKYHEYEYAAIAYKPFVKSNPQVFNRMLYLYENEINDPKGLAELYEEKGDSNSLQKAAGIYEDLGDKKAALRCYVGFVTPNKRDPLAMRVADLYYELEYDNEALEWYTALIKINEADKDMAIRIAQLYDATKDYENAARWYESTGDPDYIMVSAEIHRNELRDPYTAAKIYEAQASGFISDNDVLLQMAAECYEEACEYRKAAKLYEKIAKSSWNWDSSLLYKAAYIYRDREYNENEYKRILRELANEKNDIDAMLELGKFEEDNGNYSKAKKWYKEAADRGDWEAQRRYDDLIQREQW